MADLRAAGYKADRLRKQGYTASEVARGGYTLVELRGERNTHSDKGLGAATYSGYTAKELRDGEIAISASEIKGAGYSVRELREGYATRAHATRTRRPPAAAQNVCSTPKCMQHTQG